MQDIVGNRQRVPLCDEIETDCLHKKETKHIDLLTETQQEYCMLCDISIYKSQILKTNSLDLNEFVTVELI